MKTLLTDIFVAIAVLTTFFSVAIFISALLPMKGDITDNSWLSFLRKVDKR
jgi:hypothetical protein